MRWELFVALRYLRARRKQTMMSVVTAISVVGVTVGVMALIIALGLMSGFQTDIKAKILGSNAHVLIFPWTADGLDDPGSVITAARAIDGVVAAAPVIYQRGMAVNERSGSESPVLVKGVVPELEVEVTDIGSHMEYGSLQEIGGPPPPGPAPIVLGADLAKELDALPGDQVRIVALHVVAGPAGMAAAHPANRAFEVTGLFRSGMWDYDNEWAYVSLATAQQFYRMGDRVSLVEVRVAHPDQAAVVAAELARRLGSRFRVQSWEDLNRPFFSALKVEKVLLFLVISLIGVVAGLNIATTLVMTVMEKGRDIAILMAMGASPAAVTRVFRYQGLIIGTVGTAVGLVGGIGACFILDRYHLIRLSAEVYYITYVPFRIEPLDFSLVALSALLVSFLATIYPARHASRMAPCEALRYE